MTLLIKSNATRLLPIAKMSLFDFPSVAITRCFSPVMGTILGGASTTNLDMSQRTLMQPRESQPRHVGIRLAFRDSHHGSLDAT